MEEKNKIKIAIAAGAVIVAILGAFVGCHMANRNNDDRNTDNEYNSEQQNGENGTAPTDEPFIAPEAKAYKNDKVLKATDSSGGELSVGVTVDNVAGIVLSPTYSKATADKKIGYYITGTYKAKLETSTQEFKTEETIGESSNLFIDWTYDRLKPSAFTDRDNYGIMWTLPFDDKGINDDKVKIVAVDMSTKNILSSFTAEIKRNKDGVFELTSLYNNDISFMPTDKAEALWNVYLEANPAEDFNSEIAQDIPGPFNTLDLAQTRQNLINMAVQEIATGDYVIVEESFKLNTSVVELTDSTYHFNYLTNAHRLGFSGSAEYPLWAVTINSVAKQNGHYTFYFDSGMDHCVGCDFFYLDDSDTLEKSMGQKRRDVE